MPDFAGQKSETWLKRGTWKKVAFGCPDHRQENYQVFGKLALGEDGKKRQITYPGGPGGPFRGGEDWSGP